MNWPKHHKTDSQKHRWAYFSYNNNTLNSYNFPQPVSWSLEKRVFLVKEFYRSGKSTDCVLRNYREEFGRRDLPRPQTVHNLVRRFEETGSVLSSEEIQLASLHKSHFMDEKLPLNTGCWWASENGNHHNQGWHINCSVIKCRYCWLSPACNVTGAVKPQVHKIYNNQIMKNIYLLFL